MPSPLLCAVLAARGIESEQQMLRLLHPAHEPLHDPLLMKDMDAAAQRIRHALENNQHIAVYGDYDVDGITATCLLTEFLREQGAHVTPYIPSRFDEGYGLNKNAIAHLHKQCVALLITVDCGITAIDEVVFASSLGLDVIITDHHTCKDRLPPALAVVDPRRPDCAYPFASLAGVGVALKLAMAVAGEDKAAAVFKRYCDLAAIGTVADVMPMQGENRAIVHAGLSALNPSSRLGLQYLIAAAGIENRDITTTTIGFQLAPRLNAAGRLGQADVALSLLLSTDCAQAQILAEQLCQLNRQRQAIGEEIFEQAVEHLTRTPQQNALVLADDGWHQGVVGIVASRLAEKYACPCFMICLDGDVGKGSCRTWAGINLFEMLSGCSELLESFGGHAMAAGFTVRKENIPALRAALQAAVGAQCGDAAVQSTLVIDACITPDALSVQEIDALAQLEPLGADNQRPVLCMRALRLLSAAPVGQGRHLKLKLEQGSHKLEAIWFSAHEDSFQLQIGCLLDVAFYPQINEFCGMRTAQMQVIDLHCAPSHEQHTQQGYQRFTAGLSLTRAEALLLLPARSEFVDLWRWLKRETAPSSTFQGSLQYIARSVSRAMGHQAQPTHVLICLQVFHERGLLVLRELDGRVHIQMNKTTKKVDLETSLLMLRLKRAAELEV